MPRHVALASDCLNAIVSSSRSFDTLTQAELPVPVPLYAKNADAGRTNAVRKLDFPESVRPFRLAWIDATGIAAIHLVALLAFVPWFFSWTGVVLTFLGLYIFGTLGISLCFHRALTHRSVVCALWLEHSLAILGLCCVQDTPARWVGIHRRHHEHADEQPESPQSACRLPLGAYRLDDLQKSRAYPHQVSLAVCQGYYAGPFLRQA